MNCSVKEMVEKFDVSELASKRFLAEPLSGGRGVVDGHQLLAQSLVAAGKSEPQKTVCSIHMLFTRLVSDAEPAEILVESLGTGRSFASVSVGAWQGGRQCASGLVLLADDAPDFIHHAANAPAVPDPESCYSLQMPVDGREVSLVEDIDLMEPQNRWGPLA